MEIIFIYWIVAFALLLFMIFTNRHEMRIQWNSVATFVGVMFFVTALRICYESFKIQMGVIPSFEPFNMPVWTFSLVFWEDLFFVIPIFILNKYINCNKFIKIAIIGILSIWFGFGHLYEGWFAVALLSFYPFFISYKYGVKFGFGTVMVCHILYDVITFYTVKFMPNFLL